MATNLSEEMAKQFIKGFEETNKIIKNLESESKTSAVTLEGLKKDMESLTDTVKILNKLIREDNGERSLIGRVRDLERDVDDVHKIQENMERDFENKNNSEKKVTIEEKKMNQQIKVAVITAGMGFLTSITTVILSFVK